MERLSGSFFKIREAHPEATCSGVRLFFFCGEESLLCGSSIKISDYFFTSCVNGGETCVNEDCQGGGGGMV